MRSFLSSKPLNRRRGTMLAAFVFLIPMAMALFGMLLSRIEVSLRVTDLEQGRTQARMLAESGLAVLQDRLSQRQSIPASGLEESLGGAGRYKITPLPSPDGPGFRVEGTADLKRTRHTCAIGVQDNNGRLAVMAYQYQTISLVTPPKAQWPPEPKKNPPFPPLVLQSSSPAR